MNESILRNKIKANFTACRQLTLELVNNLTQINEEILTKQTHPDFSPVGWHLGHIAYTEELWLLGKLAGMSPLFPEQRILWAADGLPKNQRGNLPSLSEILDYLAIIREKVFAYLAIAPILEQERIWQFILQHECQHSETMTLVASMGLGSPLTPLMKGGIDTKRSFISPTNSDQMIMIPAGEFLAGDNRAIALDNESPQHSQYVDDFLIDVTPVTQANYWQFMSAGGYDRQEYWSEAGWLWLQECLLNSDFRPEPLYGIDLGNKADHPVCGVSWYEAEAYSNFIGKRLPTEAEWEKAAVFSRHDLLVDSDNYDDNCDRLWGGTRSVGYGRYPWLAELSATGIYDLFGNVWEWTNTWFAGYDGFASFPYVGYSQTYFDQQHRVLKGGSWASCHWVLRPSFRNWYQPEVRQIFAGFRCVKSGKTDSKI
jgi:ergothioneine biosynthesis protein EgtB